MKLFVQLTLYSVDTNNLTSFQHFLPIYLNSWSKFRELHNNFLLNNQLGSLNLNYYIQQVLKK